MEVIKASGIFKEVDEAISLAEADGTPLERIRLTYEEMHMFLRTGHFGRTRSSDEFFKNGDHYYGENIIPVPVPSGSVTNPATGDTVPASCIYRGVQLLTIVAPVEDSEGDDPEDGNTDPEDGNTDPEGEDGNTDPEVLPAELTDIEVNVDGTGLVGRGEPEALVTALVGGVAIGTNLVEVNGEFTIVFDEPLTEAAEIVVQQDVDGGSSSNTTVNFNPV